MGKIRMKTIGDDEAEKKQASDAKKRQEVKKQKKTELTSDVETQEVSITEDSTEKNPKKDKKPSANKQHRHTGKKYKAARKSVDGSKKYSVEEAIKLVKSIKYASFDETLELHINLRETGNKGEVQLPHGTGKELKIAVVDDALIKKIEAGNIDFDMIIATPATMPELVKFARVLGPKGLMPNPKNGTVTDKPEEAIAKFRGGAVRFQSEAKFPIIHQAVGKVSFTEKQLAENLNSMLGAIKKKNILSAFLSATMTPSVQLDVELL